MMSMRAGWSAGVALAMLGLTPAHADTLQQALIGAYGTSPVLAAQRAQLRATDETVPIAKAQSRLQVGATVGVTQSTDGIASVQNGGRVLTGGLNLSYPLFQGGRVRNAINAAESRVVAGRADLRVTEGNLFARATTAYMDVIRDTAIVGLNTSNVHVLETNLRASRDRFQVGDLTRTDVAQSEARLALSRSQLATAQGNLTRSRETYRQVIGVWPGPLDEPPPLPTLPANADEAVKIALDNNASIDSVSANSQAAGFDVRTASAARLPTFSVTGGTSYSDYLNTRAQASGFDASANNQFDQTVGQSRIGVSLSVPLYQGGQVGARVRQAQELRNATIEQGVDVERQVVSNTRAAFAGYVASGEAITANEQAVAANQLALEGARAENSAGTRTVIEVLNAEQEYLNARVLLVSARRDRYVAGFALLNAMGQAEARTLNLDGGPLYDPLSNYRTMRNRFGDWSDLGKYKPTGTRTTGDTPVNDDVKPLPLPRDLAPTTSNAPMAADPAAPRTGVTQRPR